MHCSTTYPNIPKTMFIQASDIETIENGGSVNELFSSLTDHSVPAQQVILIRATFEAGEGHGFHYHDEREEFLYILEGEVEQWVDQEAKILKAGDAVFVPPGVVHATFNHGNTAAKLLAIFGNKNADAELAVDVAAQEPWKSIR